MNKKGSALEGIRVLDLGRMVAAPHCTSILADMGADVIKVETPHGGDMARHSMPMKDGISTYFVTFNRSKRGIAIDLKSEEGKEVLWRLIKQTDVLVENFRPGVMERLGFSYEAVSKVNSRIIYASISGFGQEGEYAGRACFDPVAQAISGMTSVTGPTGGPNVRCGASIADIMAGQNACTAILAALWNREKTGRGQWIDVSLVDSLIVALSSMNQIYLTTGKIPQARGNTFEATSPGNVYPTADGQVSISAGQESEWKKLCKVLNKQDWLTDPRFLTVVERVQNRLVLDQLIAEETQRYGTETLLEKLTGIGLPAAPILHIDQVVNHPFFRDVRNMFVDVDHPQLGRVRITNGAINMSETCPYVRCSAPTLGQDNEAVLRELGYLPEEIEELQKQFHPELSNG